MAAIVHESTPSIPAASAVRGRPVVGSVDLVQDGREMVIRHGEDEYRITRSGNLIPRK